MGKIVWTFKSATHLQSIHDYIAQDSAVYARRFIHELIKATLRLEAFPCSGRIVPELATSAIREIVFQNYRIVYRVNEHRDSVEILGVVHAARDFGNTGII